MSVFRVEKTKDFTIMSNHHLRNRTISLKAKGLLSLMLSLPEDWDYTLKGLAKISLEGICAVRSGIKELEEAGYLERDCVRNEKGQFEDADYIIHEQPISVEPASEKPISENRISDNLMSEKPMSENQRQLNTNTSNTKELKTDCIKYQSINAEPEECSRSERWIDRYNKTMSEVKEQIEYDTLVLSNNAELVNDIVSVMTEVLIIDTPSYTIEKKEIPTELVRINYRKITYGRLETFLLDFSRLYSEIKNPKKYLITALYNIASTAETSITNRVNHDMYGG
jgi:hypothetical protein